MDLTIHTTDSAPTASVPALESIAENTGFVPNIAGMVATSPALMAVFDGLSKALATTSISPIDREVAGLAVDVVVGSSYGIAFHSTLLDRLGVVRRATDAGLTSEQILDIVTEYTFTVLVGTVDGLAGRIELDEFIRGRAAERVTPHPGEPATEESPAHPGVVSAP